MGAWVMGAHLFLQKYTTTTTTPISGTLRLAVDDKQDGEELRRGTACQAAEEAKSSLRERPPRHTRQNSHKLGLAGKTLQR